MKPKLFLRIASILTLVHAVLHTVGGVFGRTPPGPGTVAVTAMKANQMMIMGLPRTFWDFYRGMGLGITIFLTIESVVFWQLSSLAHSGTPLLRPIYATFLVAYLALAVNSFTYFFYGPVLAEVLIALCLALALFTTTTSRPRSPRRHDIRNAA